MAVWRKPLSARRSIRSKKVYAKKQYRNARQITTYANTSISRGVFGFGQRYRTKLRYCENVALTSATGALNSTIFRLNSLFDPQNAVGGHQPMYFDQLAAVFARYVVLGAKIKVTFGAVTETANTSNFVVGIAGSGATSFYTDPQTAMEDNHGKWTTVNGRNGNSGTRTLSLDFNARRDLAIDPYGYLTAVTADPSLVYYGILWVADLQATGTTSIILNVEIVFDCEFTNNIATPSS